MSPRETLLVCADTGETVLLNPDRYEAFLDFLFVLDRKDYRWRNLGAETRVCFVHCTLAVVAYDLLTADFPWNP